MQSLFQCVSALSARARAVGSVPLISVVTLESLQHSRSILRVSFIMDHDSNVKPTRIIVHGAGGRMGARLCELASRDATFNLVAAAERAASPVIGVASAPNAPKCQIADEITTFADVVVDFSTDHAVDSALKLAKRCRAAILVGTTGLSRDTIDRLHKAADERPVMIAPNTSLGVAVMARAAAMIAQALGQGYECGLVEFHHKHKKDAPSGTAKRLAEAVRHAGATLNDDQIAAIRGGDVIGEHTIRFAGAGEYIEITHRATSRDLFVLGALRAARWLASQPSGLWTIEDSLRLPA